LIAISPKRLNGQGLDRGSFKRDRSGPIALASGQAVIDLLAAVVVLGRIGPGPIEPFDHPHIDETDGGAVDLARYDRDSATFPAHVKIGGAMAEPVFVQIFWIFDCDADFPIGIRGGNATVSAAKRALAFPLGKFGVRHFGDEQETDVATMAGSQKLSFTLSHCQPNFRL
jgi:hypothetical protein